MKYSAFLLTLLLTTSCATLPTIEEQKLVTARQSFDLEYEFAITSHYDSAVVQQSETMATMSTYQPDARTYVRKMLGSAFESYPPSLSWLSTNTIYNFDQYPSELEEVFAQRIRNALNVTPVFIPRSQVSDRLGTGLTSSAMLHAKAIAAEKGYDAVAVIYFTPVFVAQNNVLDISNPLARFTLYYRTHLAVRAVDEDQLMYSSISDHRCDDGVMGGELDSDIKDRDKLLACVKQIQSAIVGKFLDFANDAVR